MKLPIVTLEAGDVLKTTYTAWYDRDGVGPRDIQLTHWEVQREGRVISESK